MCAPFFNYYFTLKRKKIHQVYEHSGHKWYFEQENVHTLVETTCLLLSYVRHSHKTIIDIEYEMLYAKNFVLTIAG